MTSSPSGGGTNTPAVVSAVGGLSQAAGQSQAGYGTQVVDLSNADSTNVLQQETASAGVTRATQIAQQTSRNIGSQKAAAGASGVDVNQGSPLSVMSDTATQGELNKQLSQWQTATQVASLIQQGKLDIYQGNLAEQAGQTASTGSLLSSGAAFAALLA